MKKNFFLLWLYSLIVIAKANVLTIAGKTILAAFLVSFLLLEIAPSVGLFYSICKPVMFLAGFMLVVMPVFNALEEALHMGICIQHGTSGFIRGLRIIYLATRANRRIAMSGVATKFEGTFTFSEKTRMHAGAPLTILFFLCAALVLIRLTTDLSLKRIIWFWAVGAVFPAGSLVPVKFAFESDGSCVLKDMKRYNESFFRAVRESIIGIYYGIRFIILGSLRSRTPDRRTRGEYAYQYFTKGDLENAVSVLEEELKGDENNPEICNNLAWCYAELGINIDKAISLARRAVEIDTSEAIYHDTLGWCYFKSGNVEMAKKEVSLAMEIDPDSMCFGDHMKEIGVG